jgi:hypothetical protein
MLTLSDGISRILEKLGQRGSMQNLREQDMLSAEATSGPFSKHAPYIISELMGIQASRAPLPTDAKEALQQGLYTLLDLCGSYGREAVLAGLDSNPSSLSVGGKSLFKQLVADWEKYHLFTGKV